MASSPPEMHSGCPRAGFGSRNLVWGAGFWKATGREGVRGPAHVPRSARSGEGVISAWRFRKQAAGEGAAALPLTHGEGEVDPPRSLPSARTDAFRVLRLREPKGKTRLGKGRHVGGRTPVYAMGEGAARWESGTRCGARDALHARSLDPRLDAGTLEFPAAGAGTTPRGGGERGAGTPEKPLPGHRGKGGQRPYPPPRGMFPEPRESAGGRRAVWGTRA